MVKNRYFIATVAVIVITGIYFTFGTKKYDAKKDFEQTKKTNTVYTSNNLVLLVKKSHAISSPKVINIFGTIDKDAITITSSISSVVLSIRDKGIFLHKGDPVINLINGVLVPMPFDGKLLDTFVKKGQSINVGSELFIAIPNRKQFMEIKTSIPVVYESSIKNGVRVHFTHNEKSFSGKVSYISNAVEENAGTVMVSVQTPWNDIPHGTVLNGTIDIENYQAHFIPKVALFLKNEKTYVKTIDINGTVNSKEVYIINENEEGFFVTGLDLDENIIIRNPSYAKDGQTYKFTISNIN